MDDTTADLIRALAEKNGLDPDTILAIETADGLPEELRDAMAAVLGDLTMFGQALDALDE
ncbi:hypothetical protein [Pseudodesulfovibrio sediminis]|uniref:Uncharacterized protein n=1 Tax=Pseudodesulfovibrio sediminis TaxID=2810563 RepID=A0ABN6EQN9_9BACT|nr:hypothetical protein [Pseudodesulfovibrio sediminis]BCS88733.1 hypothetical protein PSDVSF_19750 [Pseudodesulfovibrio sediminis]